MIVAGIDYSMTSPAICVHKGETWSLANCNFYYLLQKDKYLVNSDMLIGALHGEWSTPEQRFYNLAKWSLDALLEHRVSSVCLEGYAYGAGSKGLVFQIGENTGVLKQRMSQEKIPFIVTPPTVIKKFATGTGNSNKEKMLDAFIEETNCDLYQIFAMKMPKKKDASPISDIIDAYYLAKYQHQQITMASIL
jgi:Holliday junction resolvasome RuvABC endonuclease subunit